ncbi:hypothetical protein LSUE1_G002223 [Lachnellula suecica]|uniref:Uncharacterized protein n=1 Tax=Lachnellula suecica TaxID=602035 RepID=A0A8T9CHE6_9HELO|nr:hypothetical protein LSUE1_G002223 [Lachnellula suecica]
MGVDAFGANVEVSSVSDDSRIRGDEIKNEVPRYQRVYNFFGFKRSYNFPLFIIFAGAMAGFSLARLRDFRFDLAFAENLGPGFMFYYQGGSYKVGILMHLAGCLPAGLLMVFQFVPAIRHRFILFHRINGYIILLLLLISNIGASIALRHNSSGDTRTATQTAEALLVIMTTIGLALSYYNIKRLQIDQHRAWMLRSMFYFGAIITTRVFISIGAVIISKKGDYYSVWECANIDFTFREFGFPGGLEEMYPECLMPNGTVDGRVVVKAVHDFTKPIQAGSMINIMFSASIWLAIAVHIIGVEIYLNLTPLESKRLRQISYERALAAGFKNPGNTGTTAQRFGDAEEYVPLSS